MANSGSEKNFEIEVIAGPHQGEKFHLSKSEISVGRGADNTLCLDKDPRISRQHIKILISESDAEVFNLSSKNLLLVDSFPVQEKKITSDSKIQIGDSVLLFKGQFKSLVVSEPLIAEPKLSPAPIKQNPQNSILSQNENKNQLSGSLSQIVSQNLQVKPSNKSSIAYPAGRESYLPQQMQPDLAQAVAFKSAQSAASKVETKASKRSYIILGLILVLGFFFFRSKVDPVEVASKEPLIRNPAFVESDQRALSTKIQLLKKNDDEFSVDRRRRVDENMIRGLRDLQQGNYPRALESFLVVVSIDPENNLARRNYHNAKIKLDEQIKYHILQAKKYREKRNYRLCVSNYQSAESLLLYTRDTASSKQAQQGREFCDLCLQKGAQACQDLK